MAIAGFKPHRKGSRYGKGDESVRLKAQEMLDLLAGEFGIPAPTAVFGMTKRHATYYRKDRTVRLRASLPWNQDMEYSIIHEFAHHVIYEKKGEMEVGFRLDPHGKSFAVAVAMIVSAYGHTFTEQIREYIEVQGYIYGICQEVGVGKGQKLWDMVKQGYELWNRYDNKGSYPRTVYPKQARAAETTHVQRTEKRRSVTGFKRSGFRKVRGK